MEETLSKFNTILKSYKDQLNPWEFS
jgi:hypothetical protein